MTAPLLEGLAVAGFEACGVAAGLKADDALDVALLVSGRPTVAAATFTRNRVQAAPVLYDRALLARTRDVRAVVINAKNANACTGDAGLRDAARMAAVAAAALHLPDGAGVFVMSTGVIGVPMPMDRIEAGIRAAAVACRPDGLGDAARAIMTTDTRPKTARATVDLGGTAATLVGVAKGSGMIHPDMGTMLGVVLTDAAVAPEALDAALREAVDRSYNCISVDGDTSTNDTCVALANAACGAPAVTCDGPRYAAFAQALQAVCQDLARQIAFDGEGASRAVTIEVRNAGGFEAARQVGRTIATSPLVKTAIYGRDANWGRVLAAAGRAGVEFDAARCSLWFGDLQMLRDGAPTPLDEARALAILSEPALTVRLDLGGEPGDATVWTCDLSHDYVTINGAYRT